MKNKTIKLTRGHKTIVDAWNYESLSKFKWREHNGYAKKSIHKSRYHVAMHRVLLWAPPGYEIDHINGNGLDNRLENLRIVTHAQNIRNMKPRSKYKGVHWNTKNKKWISQIGINGGRTYLGSFNTQKEAAKAYDQKAKEVFGEYARLNLNK